MRHHGWASLAFLGLTGTLLAQQEASPPQLLRVPSAQALRGPDARSAEPAPLPLRTVEAESGLSLEDELIQLRRELQSFDAARDEVLRSTKTVDAESDRVAIQQRQELLDVLTKLATKGITRRSKPVVPSTPQVTSVPPATSAKAVDPFAEPVAPVVKPPVAPAAPKPVVIPEPPTFPIPDDPVDPFALGNVLFRSGDYAAAEKAFAKVQPTDENRMMLKFLTATCLRKRSQWKPASDAFRVVAGSNQDPVLRDLAKWQLDNMAWYQQTESQLDQMRAERDKRTATSKSRSATADAAKP